MSSASSAQDAVLLEQIAQGQAVALSCLYDRYGHILYSLAYKILASVEEAEEVVVDVFSQVWQGADRFDPERGKVDSWLFTITRSRALDRLRTRQRRDRITEVAIAAAKVVVGPEIQQPESSVIIAERREIVIKALEQLPTSQRQLIELAYYRGLTHSEIAQQADIPLGTVKTRIRLGLTKLRQSLAGLME